ncbi:MAG: hypothetical protein AABY01_01370, partial [Nanoarchaeota archaeon]
MSSRIDEILVDWSRVKAELDARSISVKDSIDRKYVALTKEYLSLIEKEIQVVRVTEIWTNAKTQLACVKQKIPFVGVTEAVQREVLFITGRARYQVTRIEEGRHAADAYLLGQVNTVDADIL